MTTRITIAAVIAVAVSAIAARSPERRPSHDRSSIASACTADSSYQRLSFWVGTWDVVDSTGAHYATQRVTRVLEECAVIAEWTGTHGDKGISLSAFDPKTKEWKQVYASNQVPAPSSIKLRRSDPSYSGPGLRFIPLVDTADDSMIQTRVTIFPLNEHRTMQLFEDSRDAGKTWHLVFKAEHRLQQPDGQ
jgi:hypothetical protein